MIIIWVFNTFVNHHKSYNTVIWRKNKNINTLIWFLLHDRSGIDVNNIVESGETFQNTERAEGRDKTLSYMTKQMDR